MITTIERPPKQATFTERWFEAHRRGELAGQAGRIAVSETIGLEKRFDAEIASGFSEALNGIVKTSYDFGVIEGYLVADDGERFEDMMIRSRAAAQQVAELDHQMLFVLDRFNAEFDELQEQQRMVRGETQHNTIVTFSPMTMELRGRPDLLKAGFQRPDVARSMVRVSFWDGQRLHILTRSLDNSSLELLQKTASRSLGYDFGAGDSLGMLNERIAMCSTLDEVNRMLDMICLTYEDQLQQTTGKDSKQGAFPPNAVDLLQFVESHKDILTNIRNEVEHCAPACRTYEEFEMMLNACLYRHLALYDELLHGKQLLASKASIGESAIGAGERAAENGTEYSLCGEVLAGATKVLLGPQTGLDSLMSYGGVRSLVRRLEDIRDIMNNKRKGVCPSCGVEDVVYGCGMCGVCTKLWCDVYRSTGMGLEIHQVARDSRIKLRKKQLEDIRNKTKKLSKDKLAPERV